MQNARRETIAFMDGDCMPAPDWLGKEVKIPLAAGLLVVDAQLCHVMVQVLIVASPWSRTS